MTDESALFSVYAVWVALLLVVTASLALTAGIAIGSGSFTGSGGDGAAETAAVTSMQTMEPRCGTHRYSNSSSALAPADPGFRLSINETVPVAARDSELDAHLDEVGEDRFVLDVRRTAGNRSTDCYLKMRYNVTVTLPDRNDYTLVRTVDRTFHAMEYGDRNSGGSYGTSHDPRPPSMSDAEWQAALNASDAYAENHTLGRESGSGSGGSAASLAS